MKIRYLLSKLTIIIFMNLKLGTIQLNIIHLITIFLVSNALSIYCNGLIINEVMSKNETVFTDFEGDTPDWIEFYNESDEIINILNFGITDRTGEIKYKLPDLSLEPGQYLIVFASGKDSVIVNEIHTNFKLSADGEELSLYDDIGSLIDFVDIPKLGPDESFGRSPNASIEFKIFEFSTPGYSNNISNELATSHRRGFYTIPFDLTITSKNKTDSIFYTLNGDVPNTGSSLYRQPIRIDYRYNDPTVYSAIPTTPTDSTYDSRKWKKPTKLVSKATVLRFRSFNNGQPTSRIHSFTFFVDSTIMEKYSLPVISLITDSLGLFSYDRGLFVPGRLFIPSNPYWSGNYFGRGNDWEREAHIEYFLLNRDSSYYQNAGIRIHGGGTRGYSQKSIKLRAKDKYGKGFFDWPLFGQNKEIKYKTFLLRTPQASWANVTMFSEILIHDIVKDLDFETQSYQPSIVYINGEYWGIYNIRERLDEYFIAEKYGIDKDGISILLGADVLIEHGSNEDYLLLIDFVKLNDITKNEIYFEVADKMDIDSYIDYFITEIYFVNYDWPFGNIKYWKDDNRDSKWKWILYDMDAGLMNINGDMFKHATLEGGTTWPNPDKSTFLFRTLLKNEIFRDKFINRFAVLLNTIFKKESVLDKIKYLRDLYRPDMNDYCSRWQYPADVEQWDNTIEKVIIPFVEQRPCIVREQIMEFFNLVTFDFQCGPVDSVPINKFSQISIYPNPSQGIINISYLPGNYPNIAITVENVLGQPVYRLNLTDSPKSYRLDLQHLPIGIYFLSFQSGETRQVVKVAINK